VATILLAAQEELPRINIKTIIKDIFLTINKLLSLKRFKGVDLVGISFFYLQVCSPSELPSPPLNGVLIKVKSHLST
jgi:hypothetical protein